MNGEDRLPPLREVIADLDLAARKSLGQNFLLDLNLTRKIARAGGPLEGETIVEIGPGPGGLTRALLAEGAAHVIAIERDPRCLPALAQIAAVYPGQLTVIEGDAIEADEPSLLGKGKHARVVANLPYNVATVLLIKWLTGPWPPWFKSLTLMFQREVAERIVAVPNSSAYGRLSIIGQWRTAPKLLFDVNRSAFTPAPKVTSSIVRFEPLPAPRGAADVKRLERVTAAAFGQRRKMLRSSLKSLNVDTDALIAAAGLQATVRGEDLTVEQFAALAAVLERLETAKRGD